MGGVPSPGYPGGMPGMPQSGYPSMPQGSPYGGLPAPGYPPNQPGYPGGSPGYGGNPSPYPPSVGYPGTAYPGMVMPRGITGLELDVALLRQVTTASGKQVAIMQDGDTLKGGHGDPQVGDKFKVVIRANAESYIYIIAIDGSGWAQGLYPNTSAGLHNPVKPDQEYAFPEGQNWFSPDQVGGIETMYVIASPGPRPDIEEAIAKIGSHERPAGTPTARIQEPPILPSGFGATQAGQPTPVKLETGQEAQVTPTTYRAAQPGDDVRVTRWFKHE